MSRITSASFCAQIQCVIIIITLYHSIPCEVAIRALDLHGIDVIGTQQPS